MKHVALMIVVVAFVGCGKKGKASQTPPESKATPKAEAIKPEPSKDSVEAAIREAAKKPTGKVTKADLEKVKEFNFYGNQLTDVSAMAGLTQLEVLILGENNITDIGALAGLKKLKVLELNNNQLTDVSALAGLKRLKELDLRNNPNLTKAEIDKLKKMLPRCRIYRNATK